MVEIEIEIGIDSRPAWHLALTHCLNLDAEYCQRRNNIDPLRGLLWPNPIPRPFDTAPDPELASPLTFSDDL